MLLNGQVSEGEVVPVDASLAPATSSIVPLEFIALDWMSTGWFALQVIVATIAIIIFISSLDDLFVDLTYWYLRLRNIFSRNIYGLPRHADDLSKKPEQQLAMMVPAWDESAVIGRMIANTINNQVYNNYHIFIGVYPNDPETRNEVDRLSQIHPNVHRIDVGHDGPTSKADCLNWVIQGVFLYEREQGLEFAGMVLHDAEDVINPYSLKISNWILPDLDLIQLPVFSMPRNPLNFVASHYMDEFAEWHSKDMIVREYLTGIVPSAGVATTFSRRAILRLADEENNLPFNTESLTEDYDIAQRMEELGLKGGFVRHRMRVPYEDKRGRRRTRSEIISTREFFPDKFVTSYRQKARWMLGIAYVGWEQLGWRGTIGNRYFLMRDRKSIVTAPVGMLAYVVIFNVGLYFLWLQFTPQSWQMAPLIEPGSLTWFLVIINLIFLAWRVLHRFAFVLRLHGPIHALLSPARIVLANFISFFASARAFRQYIWSRLTGARLTWDKTQHAYPSASEILASRPRLGEILSHMGVISAANLSAALADQAKLYRPLGLMLLDKGLVNDQALAQSFAEMAGYDYETFNPLEVPPEVRELLSPKAAAQYGAFPVRIRNGTRIILAVSEPPTRAERNGLNRGVSGSQRANYIIAPRGDVAYAIRFGFEAAAAGEAQRDMNLLIRSHILDEAGAERVWRVIRSSYARFGDLAIRMGFISDSSLNKELSSFWGRNGGTILGDFLVSRNVLTDQQRKDVLVKQAKDLKSPLSAAVELGLISDSQKTKMEREKEKL